MAYIGHDAGGCYVEWYRDDDGNSGYGDNARVARWYDTLLRCRELVHQSEPPAGVKWVPVGGWEPSMAPGSAAWCETYSDNR